MKQLGVDSVDFFGGSQGLCLPLDDIILSDYDKNTSYLLKIVYSIIGSRKLFDMFLQTTVF